MNANHLGTGVELPLLNIKPKKKRKIVMKKILYSIAILFSGLNAGASHLNSELLLDVHGQTLFTVSLDNRFYSHPDFRYHILDIGPGNHFLQVQTGNYYFPHHQILFSGWIQIPAASRIKARIVRFGRYHVQEITPLYIAAPVVYVQPVPLPAPPPCHMAMSDYDFDMLRNSIESKSFESTRMQIVRQVLSNRFVTARQVMELMNLMWFESSKLELAKFAFNRTVDKENYFRVNDRFSFESSIRDLDDYIRNMG